jgi:hypothetical protein
MQLLRAAPPCVLTHAFVFMHTLALQIDPRELSMWRRAHLFCRMYCPCAFVLAATESSTVKSSSIITSSFSRRRGLVRAVAKLRWRQLEGYAGESPIFASWIVELRRLRHSRAYSMVPMRAMCCCGAKASTSGRAVHARTPAAPPSMRVRGCLHGLASSPMQLHACQPPDAAQCSLGGHGGSPAPAAHRAIWGLPGRVPEGQSGGRT